MQRFVTAALLLLASAVHAEPASRWHKVGTTEKDVTYVDVESLAAGAPDAAHFWMLTDYKAPRSLPIGGEALSQKALFLINCSTREYALGVVTSYAGPDGTGSVLFSHNFAESAHNRWEPITPDSVVDSFARALCARQ